MSEPRPGDQYRTGPWHLKFDKQNPTPPALDVSPRDGRNVPQETADGKFVIRKDMLLTLEGVQALIAEANAGRIVPTDAMSPEEAKALLPEEEATP